jgi:hypothetical protein
MTRLFSMALIFALSIVAAVTTGSALANAPARTSADAIDSYFGDWQGKATATSETDEDFPTSSRDIAVTLARTDIGGFLVSWSTLQRQKGNPDAPLEVMKSTTVEFVPAPAPNTWRSKSEIDPYGGNALYWARIDGSGLVISSFAINESGKPELQTYRRSLRGKEMRLEFTNVTDGKLVRTVKGSLRRIRAR